MTTALGSALLSLRRSVELMDRLAREEAPTERRALRAISELQSVNGYCPSLAQLATSLGSSKAWTRDVVAALRTAGVVACEPRVGHSIRVAKPEELSAARERAWSSLFALLPAAELSAAVRAIVAARPELRRELLSGLSQEGTVAA